MLPVATSFLHLPSSRQIAHPRKPGKRESMPCIGMQMWETSTPDQLGVPCIIHAVVTGYNTIDRTTIGR